MESGRSMLHCSARRIKSARVEPSSSATLSFSGLVHVRDKKGVYCIPGTWHYVARKLGREQGHVASIDTKLYFGKEYDTKLLRATDEYRS